MIWDVSPDTRLALVRGRVTALKDGADASIALLDAAKGYSTPDSMVVALLKAEVLYLDRQEAEAQAVFDTHVKPRLIEFSPEVAVLLADNSTLIAQAQFAPGLDDFYHLVDQRRLLGIDLSDHAIAVHIAEAVRSGEHYKALPLCWQQLLHAYDSQCWRRFLLAELEMARECLALGWLHKAAYHGMLSCDTKFIAAVSERLLGGRDPDAVRKTLDQLLPASRLARHASVVAALLRSIVDVIPDDRLGTAIEWLLKRAAYIPRKALDPSLLEPTWQTIQEVSARLNAAQAKEFIDIALAHPWFQTPNVHRRHLIDAINACVHRVDRSDLGQIADKVLPLAGSLKSDMDFINTVNLYCHIVERGDDTLREHFKASLYPLAQKTSSNLLIQVAHHFGAQLQDTDELDNAAIYTAKRIARQVEDLAPDEDPAKLGGYGTISKDKPDSGGKRVVHVGGAQQNLDALVPHRSGLSEGPLRELIAAILQMIANSDNIITNRTALVQSLRGFADRIPTDLIDRVVAVLRPLADGNVSESDVAMSHAEATSPLNPFKLGSGDPSDLCGVSLMAITELEGLYPGAVVDLNQGLLLRAMSAVDVKKRAFGCAAAKLCSQLGKDEQLMALLCTSDADPQTASAAFSVYKRIRQMDLEETIWTMLVSCMERASSVPQPRVRRAAAIVAQRSLQAPDVPDTVRDRLRRLCAEFSIDVSYSVRSAIDDTDGWTACE